MNALHVFAKTTRTLHVITTCFRESMEWMRDLCTQLENVQVLWFIYSKNPDESLEQVQLRASDMELDNLCLTQQIHVMDHRENVGREGLAWSDYIFSNNSLNASIHVFLQGHPEFDLKLVASFVHNFLFQFEIPSHFEPFFFPVMCEDDPNKLVHFFEEEYNMIIRKILKLPDGFCTSYRGEFAITSATWKMFKNTYEGLFKTIIIPALSMSNDPPMGHVLERIWMPTMQRPIAHDYAGLQR